MGSIYPVVFWTANLWTSKLNHKFFQKKGQHFPLFCIAKLEMQIQMGSIWGFHAIPKGTRTSIILAAKKRRKTNVLGKTGQHFPLFWLAKFEKRKASKRSLRKKGGLCPSITPLVSTKKQHPKFLVKSRQHFPLFWTAKVKIKIIQKLFGKTGSICLVLEPQNLNIKKNPEIHWGKKHHCYSTATVGVSPPTPKAERPALALVKHPGVSPPTPKAGGS